LYYRKIRVFGTENLPEDGAVIIISNHQNALMDPVVSCVLIKRQIHWLTRADVFRNPLANALLRNLNMMPVYRAHDRADLRTANDPTFLECTRRLRLGAVVGLFPEGTHHGGKYLKSLKKGLARIALSALNEIPDKKIFLVPVGVDYENSFYSGYDLAVSIGKPIDISHFRGRNPTENVALQEFVTLSREVLSREMIEMNSPEMSESFAVLEDILADLEDERSGIVRSQDSAFSSLHHTLFSPVKVTDESKWKNVADQWIHFQKGHEFQYLRGTLEEMKNGKSRLGIYILYALFLPLHFIAMPFKWLVGKIVKALIKDVYFTSSIKILVAPAIWTSAFLMVMPLLIFYDISMWLLPILPFLTFFYLKTWPSLGRKVRVYLSARAFARVLALESSNSQWLIIRQQIANLLVENRCSQ
jgi:1-acyl-sn-glycerol-3-phosphate acyltransferase